MKRVILTLFLISITCILYAQYVDVSYPFHNKGSGAINSGLGYNQKIKSVWFIQYRAAYAQYKLNDNSTDILDGSIGIGRTWMLNTATPMKIGPTIFLGYINELIENESSGSVHYGLEVDYQIDALTKFSFPFAFQRYDSKNFTINLFRVGIRFHPFR